SAEADRHRALRLSDRLCRGGGGMTALRQIQPAPEDVVETTEPRVSIVDVGKTFTAGGASTAAVSAVSLDIPDGQFVSLVGRSGSGKSTLLRLVAGLLTPTEGAVTVDGRRVSGPPASARYVFQDYGESLFPWLTARD